MYIVFGVVLWKDVTLLICSSDQSLEYIQLILLFALSTSISPGPNNVMNMASGLNFGVRKSIPHLLGISLGFAVMVIFVGTSLGAMFYQFPTVHLITKLAGTSYVLYLAWVLARADVTGLNEKVAKPMTFAESALFQWVNPKSWVMATGAVATFVSMSQDIYFQVLIISLSFMIISLPGLGFWLILGVWLKTFFDNSLHQKWFNIFMSLMLICSAIPIVLELLERAWRTEF